MITSLACSRPSQSQTGLDSKIRCSRRWHGRHVGTTSGVELATQAIVAAVVQVPVPEVPRAAAGLTYRLSAVGGGPALLQRSR
jgi:hypothetical protein